MLLREWSDNGLKKLKLLLASMEVKHKMLR
jgi:hypothetical protein